MTGSPRATQTGLPGKTKAKTKAFVWHMWILGLIVGGYETIAQNSMNNSEHKFVCSKQPRGKSSWIAFV